MSTSIARAGTAAQGGAWRRPTPGAALLLGLAARLGALVRRLGDAARHSEMDPRLARDIGVLPDRHRGLEGFAVAPRPLWGVGLTPQPTGARRPPRAERRRG